MKRRSAARADAPVTVVATAGPSLFSAGQIRAIARLGRILFRVNGAHGSVASIGETIRRIRRAVPSAQIMLDLPGRKVRVSRLKAPLELKADRAVRLAAEIFNEPSICLHVRTGQTLIANDGRTRMKILSRSKSGLVLEPVEDGILNIGKGVHVGAALAALPLFASRDLALLHELPRWPATHIGLSFVCIPEDVDHARRSLSHRRVRAEILPKIETAAALDHLSGILKTAGTFILDRGDLASEIGLEHLPAAQERILRETAAARTQLIVATQLLKSMEEHPIPFIAELTEIHRLLERGIYGLQLSEETAIGKHPAACVRLIMDMSRRVIGDAASQS